MEDAVLRAELIHAAKTSKARQTNEERGAGFRYVTMRGHIDQKWQLDANRPAIAKVVGLVDAIKAGDAAGGADGANEAAIGYLKAHPLVGAFIGMFAADGCAKGGSVTNQSSDPEQAAHPFRQFGGYFSVNVAPRAYFGDDVHKCKGVEGARAKEGDVDVVDYSIFYTWRLADPELVKALKCAPVPLPSPIS